MILSAHQPTYLPWLGLFHKIWLSDVFVFFDTVQYLPKEWMNRNYIRGKKDKLLLSVPVNDKGFLNKSVKDLKINNNINWKRKHLDTIKLNYRKTVYFENYIDSLEKIYSLNWNSISELNFEMLNFFIKELGLKTKVIKSSDYNFIGKKSDLVLNMCVQLKSEYFIFGSQGKNYADQKKFEKKKVKIFFQDYIHPKYKQINNNFFSHLSIIDLLFNCGPSSLEVLTKNQNSFGLK